MTLAGEEKGLILKAITPEPKENVEWPYRPIQADARDVKLGTSGDVARLCFSCAQIALYESSIVLGANWLFKRDVLIEAGFSYAKATEEDGKECLLYPCASHYHRLPCAVLHIACSVRNVLC